MTALAHERESPAAWLRESRPEAPSLPIEKAPQLNASLERFAEAITDLLLGVCGEGASGSTERIATTTTFELFGAYQNYPTAILRSAALDSRAVMIFDENIVEVLLNSIFGVDPAIQATLPAEDSAPRERTEFETQILHGFARTLSAGICNAFAPVASFDLNAEGVHNIKDVNLLGPREMAAIMAHYTIKTRAGAFRLILALPQPLTLPLAEMFARGPDPTAAKLDPQWTRRMESGVSKAKLSLTAVLDNFEMSLFDVADFQVGTVLPLSHAGDGHVRIECVERGVFLCRLGESVGRYALEIEDILANNPDDEYYVAP